MTLPVAAIVIEKRMRSRPPRSPHEAKKGCQLCYQECIDRIVLDPSQLVFLDETQKDRNSSRRRRSWFRRGRNPFRDAYFAGSHGKRYTLVAACDINGFIIEACETILREEGPNDTDETRGTVNRDRFRLWIQETLVPVLGNYSRLEPRSIVVMDNASIHSGADIQDLIEATGARLVYLPPYSPDKNPIELMFGEYKKCLKRHSKHYAWRDAHVFGLYSVDPKMARNFFRKAGVPGCEALEERDKVNRTVVVLVVAALLLFGIIP
jgi:transposase